MISTDRRASDVDPWGPPCFQFVGTSVLQSEASADGDLSFCQHLRAIAVAYLAHHVAGTHFFRRRSIASFERRSLLVA